LAVYSSFASQVDFDGRAELFYWWLLKAAGGVDHRVYGQCELHLLF